ncbi:MAG: DUF2268 domain-containing putative Zn-dependent protease [Steroidobacteraceae bacterium]
MFRRNIGAESESESSSRDAEFCVVAANPDNAAVLRPIVLGATALIGLLGSVPIARACEFIDAYSAVAKLAADTAASSAADQLRAFQTQVIARFPGLYDASVLGLSAGARLDAAILASLAAARESRTRVQLLHQLEVQISRASKDFAAFRDFRCDFPIYMADTLGQLDGAGRRVAGRPALVFGIGNLDVEQSSISLPTLIAHELFHRYHFEAAGFSDDLADRQPIWQVLWVEGLATYASQVLNPGVTTSEALVLPKDLEQRAAPMIRVLAADLLQHSDEVNSDVFTTYFTYGREEVAQRGLPSRSGYYVGYVVAQRIAQRHSLNDLAHLRGPSLRREIGVVLQQLSH